MKYIILSLLALYSNILVSQVLIGTNTATNTSVALEFGNEPRGIFLEPVTLPTIANAGTIIFDDSTGALRYYNGTSWSSVVNGGATNTVTDYTTQGQVIINGTTSTTNGVFVIKNTDTALVLPTISNVEMNVKSPTTGLLFYDSALKVLLCFNGNKWIYY